MKFYTNVLLILAVAIASTMLASKLGYLIGRNAAMEHIEAPSSVQ